MENGLLPLRRVMTSSKHCSPRLLTMVMATVRIVGVVVDLVAVEVEAAGAPAAIVAVKVQVEAAAVAAVTA